MRIRSVAAALALGILATLLVGLSGCARPSAKDSRVHHGAPGADTAYLAYGTIGTFGDTAGEARALAAIVFARTEEGQRVVLTFAETGGLPANTVGPGRVEMRRDLGVLRVWLPPEVDAGAMTETFWAGPLVDQAYLVRSLAGPCFVDVHLRGPVVARVRETALPAALVIELRPGGAPVPEPAPRARRVVLLEPRAGEASYPLAIGGYARAFEATVALRLVQEGRAVRDTFATAADYVFMWGEFRATLSAGPGGALEVQAGEPDMETGAWEGVAAPVVVK